MADENTEQVTAAVIPKRIGGMSIVDVLYNFAKKIGTVAIVYVLGYYNLSIAWLIGPVVLSVIREEWKKEKEMKRNIAKAAALCQEKEVILARVDDLPSWVYFPDVERAEWLNRILVQVWPNMNHWSKTLLKDVIEPSVKDSLAAYKLHGFRFEKMVLGSIPLRVGGVKVYDRNVDRSQIIMDMDIFYAGDCDISFTLSGVRGGIRDFQIHGMMRVVMKPLISDMPLVGGLQLFFLNNPTIDFNLVGVADLLDMPGLSDILRRVIVEQIANFMVLPNKLPIKLSDVVPAVALKVPEPEGVLRVHVVEAKKLMKKDIGMLGKGKSDPYAVVTLGAQEFRTQTIDNNVNPKWDYWCETIVFESRGQVMNISVFDKDEVAVDESLGRATIDVSSVAKKGVVDLWINLEQAKHGMIHVRMYWLTLTTNTADLRAAIIETQELRVTSMSTALLILYIDSAKNLPELRPGKKPDCVVRINWGKKEEVTAMQFRTSDPIWEQGFTFLVNNPESDTLHLKVVDTKTDRLAGIFSYNLNKLLECPGLELEKQPFSLSQSGPHSKIFLSMHLKILKYEGKPHDEVPVEGPEGETVSISEDPSLQRTDSTKSSIASKSVGEPTPVKKQSSLESMKSQHSVDEVMIVTAPPAPVEASPGSELRNRAPSQTISSGEAGLGRIQLTLRYSTQRQRLVIVIHKVANLPMKDPSNIPDPYVKLYLLPERSKDSKRKTETIKDNCNPVYDQTLEYVMSQGEMNSKQLEVSVVTRKGLFSSGSPVMGQVILNLADYDLTKAMTSWFDLLPPVNGSE